MAMVADQPGPLVGAEAGDEQVEGHRHRLVGEGRLLAAGAVQHRRPAPVGPAAQLGHQPGLAGAGVAADEHEPAGAGGGPLPGVDEGVPRRGPADEGVLGLEAQQRRQGHDGRRAEAARRPLGLHAVDDPGRPRVHRPRRHPAEVRDPRPTARAPRGRRPPRWPRRGRRRPGSPPAPGRRGCRPRRAPGPPRRRRPPAAPRPPGPRPRPPGPPGRRRRAPARLIRRRLRSAPARTPWAGRRRPPPPRGPGGRRRAPST